MLKSIIKEILIILLLLIAIVLLLIVILYDYNPTDKTVPSRLQEYKLSAYVQNELEETVNTTTQNIIKTYIIEEEDLNYYEKINEYDRMKMNPFKTSTVTNVEEKNETIEKNENTGSLNTTGK